MCHCWSMLFQLPAGKNDHITLHLANQWWGKPALSSRSTSSPLCKTCHTLLVYNIQFGKQQREKLKGLFSLDWSKATKAAQFTEMPPQQAKISRAFFACNMPLYCRFTIPQFLWSIETLWLRSRAQPEWEASLFRNENSQRKVLTFPDLQRYKSEQVPFTSALSFFQRSRFPLKSSGHKEQNKGRGRIHEIRAGSLGVGGTPFDGRGMHWHHRHRPAWDSCSHINFWFIKKIGCDGASFPAFHFKLKGINTIERIAVSRTEWACRIIWYELN